MKTLNERVNEVVKIAISDKNATSMVNAKKRIEKELAENTEYQELLKAVENFKLDYYYNDDEYTDIAFSNVRSAFRAASKMVKGINIPFEYTDDEETTRALIRRNFVDTDARIASLICKRNENFTYKVGRAKLQQFEEWSDEEKEKINTLVELGILTEEEAETKLKNGKPKK